ncbi:unnamed protein product [Rotaria socialis]|uniref:ABC transporter domain-containing protein n=1 Tax=Rotaria socialis TaxID=392032 RepID=A0A821ERB0_9BILA|nr:unnamed protein product [Rotaria socialis]CAF4468792.1 unnamed protein product [Rotaria socialis]CAF4639906.1 unnamed protein product [Rotaria socialis]
MINPENQRRELWRQKFPTIIAVLLSIFQMLLTLGIVGCEVGISLVQFPRMDIFVGYWTFPNFMCAWISLAAAGCCCRIRCCGITALVFQILALPLAVCVIGFDAYFLNHPTYCFFSSDCNSWYSSSSSNYDPYGLSNNSTLYGIKVPIVQGQLAAGVLMLVACVIYIIVYAVTSYRVRKGIRAQNGSPVSVSRAPQTIPYATPYNNPTFERSFVEDSAITSTCLPNKNQAQWSFNPECSAGPLCQNPQFIKINLCDNDTITSFYTDPTLAVSSSYNFEKCGQNSEACQAGFFSAQNLTQNLRNHYACCPGYFCPEGQLCLIPCRPGSYCPSELKAIDGTCKSPAPCQKNPSKTYERYGCGGSTFEGFCPPGSFCTTPRETELCSDNTIYCPTGVEKPLACPSHFVCLDGRARRQRLLTNVVIAVVVIIIIFVSGIEIFQWLALKKNLWGQKTFDDRSEVSDYFMERSKSKSKPTFQLNIHLYKARLRNVTRFDMKRNEGFTGRITAGRLTALMGGSGCGKSSLLDTIHGRRRLHANGYIKFGEHEPLSNILTDYIGYVPQADIMHEDLTVFETVYYSARARRLGDSQTIIKNDVGFVLKKLQLEFVRNNMTKTLSGGQRKRVNIAMEIAACPKVLLLDEPTSGLDTFSCDHLFDLLQLIKYSAAGPVTIIMVIHQPSQELFLKIDDIFFLTAHCCLAYQGPRDEAKEFLAKKFFDDPTKAPPPRHNDCDTCFIMLTKAPDYIENHKIEHEINNQPLNTYSWKQRFFLPFLYILLRSMKQTYVRGVTAEASYTLAYFLLGACVGYLFENKLQGECDIQVLPTIYFLMSLSFGILTCISSQRLFGVETTNKTFERESRNYFHPFQYWLAKSLVDIFRMIFYPLLYLSMLYIEVVPRGPFSYYLGIMILVSFVCSGIGQLTSVIFSRTEYAYLAGTIVALLSCLLSGFSPIKADLGQGKFIVTLSFSRHAQRLLFRHETSFYAKAFNGTRDHIWFSQISALEHHFSFNDNEDPNFWLVFIGFVLRFITFLFLYAKSEYRSKARFRVTHIGPMLQSLFRGEPCRKKASKSHVYQL